MASGKGRHSKQRSQIINSLVGRGVYLTAKAVLLIIASEFVFLLSYLFLTFHTPR